MDRVVCKLLGVLTEWNERDDNKAQDIQHGKFGLKFGRPDIFSIRKPQIDHKKSYRQDENKGIADVDEISTRERADSI